MNIEITQDDINQGTPHSVVFCPIALAVGRKMDSCVEVSKGGIVVDDKCFKMTKACKSFIVDFDYNKPVNPFKFRLMVKS